VVRPGDEVKVKILEVDDSRRRLSLSVKRVEGQELPLREPEEGDVSAESEEAPVEGAPEGEVETPEAPPEEAPPEEAPEEEPPDELPEEAPPEEQPVPDEGR
jgi:small subunit ribosomal protein S1